MASAIKMLAQNSLDMGRWVTISIFNRRTAFIGFIPLYYSHLGKRGSYFVDTKIEANPAKQAIAIWMRPKDYVYSLLVATK